MCKNNNIRTDVNTVVNTPYDNAYRTLLDSCPRLMIPLINEIFGENYTGSERIEQSPNEFFIITEGNRKIVTDSVFTVTGEHVGHYHIECQSTPDGTILIRMFKYDSQIAVRYATVTENVLTVKFPNSAVLYLRSTANTPDVSVIKIETPGGSVEYEVKSLMVKEYSIEEIFEKNLLLLIPFHIFTYEASLKMIEDNETDLEQLKLHYAGIRHELEGRVDKGRITSFDKQTIIEMSNKVIDSLANKYERVRKEVGEVMGGEILETEAKKILEQGREEGREQGLEEGSSERARETAAIMLAEGEPLDKIGRYTGLPIELIEAIKAEKSAGN